MTLGVRGVLDDAGALRRFDAGGMLDHVARLGDQITDAWILTRALAAPPESHRGRRVVALLGMGGSAIGADLVRGIFADRLSVPLVTLRDYELPAFVGGDTLVIASSYSGSTEETVTALSTALERRAPVAIITTGGPLGEVAARAGLPHLLFPGGGQPRAAVGYSVVLLAGLLERLGMLTLDEVEIRAASDAVARVVESCGPEVPSDRNPAKQLAWTLVDRLPVVEASGFLAPVARRWKTQLNENGKTMAVFEELPEATHNTVVGYRQPETIRDHLYVVFLASPSDHPRNGLRAALSQELLGSAQIGHQVVPVGGDGKLAQAMSAVALGDLVSTYLAFLYGEDPTPVEAIGHVKARLAEPEDDSDD
jgi:glucose/mannose-6-phosphate isomerase